MQPRSWLRHLLSGLCLVTLSGDPAPDLLYPGVRTREHLLRGALPPFNTADEAIELTCLVAATAIPRDIPFVLYADDRLSIDRYKNAWVKVCDHQTSDALGQAFQQAKQIELMLHETIFSHDLPPAAEKARENERKDRIYQRLDALDMFMPAFYGTAEGLEFYAANYSLYYLFALSGSADDQAFFRLHYRFRGQGFSFPWTKPSKDVPLCTRYGDFNWIRALGELERGLTNIREPIYRQQLVEWRTALLAEFFPRDDRSRLCSCSGGLHELISDAGALQHYLAKAPEFAEAEVQIARLLKLLQAGTIKVQNYEEAGCSY